MKINSIQRDNALKQGTFGLHSGSTKFRGMNEGVYGAGYGGSFTGKSETAANAMKRGGILTSKWFNKLLTYTNDHNVSTSALVALALAGILRPATIMTLPGKKDKEDKIYASGHSIASAILGFVASVILTSPLDGAVKKLFEAKGMLKDKDGNIIKDSSGKERIFSKTLAKIANMEVSLEKSANMRDSAGKIINREAREQYKSMLKHRANLETLAKNIPDWIIAVPRSILTIALIPPILKYVFGVEKKKKQEPMNTNNTNTTMDFIEKPVFQAVKGGVK